MEINNGSSEVKVLAFYLPQFYPTPLNNTYYGKGFTEWTNVGKAKPLFKGHKQPKIPTELGYYDLRVPEVALQQVELAREAGVFGFAYWHYWWDGELQLNEPAERMLLSGSPDFPFMFAWANENWYKKLWTSDSRDDILIMEQTYPGEDDNKAHFNYCLPFLKDKRYITVDGRPVFLIYRPMHFEDVSSFIRQWNDLIKQSGIADSFYFVAMEYKEDEFEYLKSIGFDCVTPQHTLRTSLIGKTKFSRFISNLKYYLGRSTNRLRTFDYSTYPHTVWKDVVDSREDIVPQLIPNWDNTPRAGRKGLIYKNSTPEIFNKAAKILFSGVRKKHNKMVFLKSWNEWAEGNFMEPDLEYGKKYIEALRDAINVTD